MHVQQPLTRLVIDVKCFRDGKELDHKLYEGECEMSQQQQDHYKSIIGDGLASVTVSRTVSNKSYGAGGDVFISLTLKCDQSGAGITTAIEYAKQLVESRIWPHHEELKQQLVQHGILTQ